MSVPPRPAGSSDATGANSRTVADERKPPSQRTLAFQVVLATSGADWIFSARLATAPMLTALIGSVLVLTVPPGGWVDESRSKWSGLWPPNSP